MNIKKATILPFNIETNSDVSGGYSDVLHSEFAEKTEITNYHEDNYLKTANYDAVIQGPFTKTWVGGRTHRQAQLNLGEDTSETRPEAWHIQFLPNTIKLYSNSYLNSPPAYWIREEFAKRPISIKNINNTERLLGNYSKNYEIFQTSGRRITNNLIVDGFEADGELTTQFINYKPLLPLQNEPYTLEENFSSFPLLQPVNNEDLESSTGDLVKVGSIAPYIGRKFLVLANTIANSRHLSFKTIFTGSSTITVTSLHNRGGGTYDLAGLALEHPDSTDNLYLQYSLDGTTWTNYFTLVTGSLNPGGPAIVEEKTTVTTVNTIQQPYYLRFSQTYTAGAFDHYALTDITASATTFIPEEEAINEPYSLPELNKISGSRSVIVERFNAPGSKEESSRGALDRQGEEMSPNIPLPYRNIKIRQPFYRQLAQHSPQFGSGSTLAIIPATGSIETVSIHKVNRNRLKRAENVQYDNWFVQHQIPRTDIQYSWITASSLTRADELGGFQTKEYVGRNFVNSGIVFLSGSLTISGSNQQYFVDNLFINSLVKDTKKVDIETNTLSISASLSASMSEYVNSPYTFTSWVSIRNADNIISRTLRDKNIISIKNKSIPIEYRNSRGNLNTVIPKHAEGTKNYKEPPVTYKYKPLSHKVAFSEDSDTIFQIEHEYTNLISKFANKELNVRFSLEENNLQFYDLLREQYQREDLNVYYLGHSYKEVVWPKEENTSLAKTRKRNAYYLDVSGSSRDGYDRQLGTQRTFWRNEQKSRKRSTTDFNGYTGSMGYSSLEETGSINFDFNETIEISDIGGIEYVSSYDQIYIPEAGQKVGLHNSVAVLDNISEEIKTFEYQCEVITGSGVNQGQISVVRRYGLKFDTAGEFNHNFIDSYGMHLYKGYEDIPYDVGSFYSNTYYKAYLTSKDTEETVRTIQTDNDEVLLNPKLRYIAFVGGGELNTGSEVQDASFLGPGNTIDVSQYMLESSLSSEDVYFSTLDYGLIRTTENDSGRRPFFDSYEEYIEPVRSIAKEYSTIPEFKISDHMEYYSDGNFRSNNQRIFILDGQEEYESAEAENGPQNKQFYKSYLQSDLLKKHDKIREENRENSQIKSIKIKVSGIKKLLPYNGFYPQDRSVQIANLYADYVDKNLKGGLYSIGVEDYGNKGKIFNHFGCVNSTPIEERSKSRKECSDADTFYYQIGETTFIATIDENGNISTKEYDFTTSGPIDYSFLAK